MKFAREVDSGNLHVNWSSQWRADLMPYGGLKDSGLGKEGPEIRHPRDDRRKNGRAAPEVSQTGSALAASEIGPRNSPAWRA